MMSMGLARELQTVVIEAVSGHTQRFLNEWLQKNPTVTVESVQFAIDERDRHQVLIIYRP